MKTIKIVLVEWIDAISQDTWEDSDKELEPVRIFTAGVLIRESKLHIEVATNHEPKERTDSCRISIPRGMIVKTKILKVLKVK